MKTEAKHELSEHQPTPRPWEIRESRVPGYERTITIVGEGHLGICGMIGAGTSNPRVLENVRANAALIVRAVNNRDGLIQALEILRSTLAPVLRDHDVRGNVDRTKGHVLVALNQIDAALAAAQVTK